MTTDILFSNLSPTQHRGESKLAGGIIHDTVCDSEGKQFKVKIEYTLVGKDVVTDLDFKVLCNHEIPASHLIEMLQIIIERAEGRTLTFQ